MKCPKCSYLGFETGDRCKNCGYDFSLMTEEEVSSPPSKDELQYDYESELILRDSERDEGSSSSWLDEVDTGLGGSPKKSANDELPRMTFASELPEQQPEPRSAFPLFTGSAQSDDEPLVRLPAAPRQPLAVRRSPDVPLPTPMSKEPRRQTPDRDHVLLFGEEPDAGTRIELDEPDLIISEPPEIEPYHEPSADWEEFSPSGVRPRLTAALIDHGILFTIDVVVIYFTLRMAGLSMGDWRSLPPAPLLAFLGMVKLAYFSAFTVVGGQTIGKMAAGIRVISNDAESLEVARAMKRAATLLLSLVTLGIGFLPALFGSDRRTLHDRMARTRVIALPSA